MTEPGLEFAYDAVAYPTPIVPELNPARIRAACALQGFAAPAAAGASVLEIGCGDGYNLLGIAAASPGAPHVGFDLSAAAIARGRAVLRTSGLSNVELAQGDITVWRGGRTFDYILCHGVHSWVPPVVQEALLGLIAAHLAPGGVAYVSHDVLPAAAPKQAIKAFLRRAIPAGAEPHDAIAAARALLADLGARQLPHSRLRPQFDVLLRELPAFEDGYFFHDWLSDAYHPVSMTDLGEAAARHGLVAIADAGLADLFDDGNGAAADALAARLGGGHAARAYAADMLAGTRMFRRTVLARVDAPPPPAADLGELSFVLAAAPEAQAGGTAYRGADNAFFRPATAMARQVMARLAGLAPREVAYADLLAETGDASALNKVLAQICSVPVANAYASPAPYAGQPGERPRASPLVNAMLDAVEFAPTLRLNRLVSKQGATRMFLALCDGTRTRADLRRDMSAGLGRDVPASQIEAVLADLAGRQVFLG